VWLLGLTLWACVAGPAAAATEEVPFEEEAAIRAAVAAIEPAVLRLETAGVSAAAVTASGEVNPASGPSTALVVDEGGWLLATAFAVPVDADQAIVVLPGPAGERKVARVIGRDLARGLVLLRAEDAALPAGPAWVPRGELAVGQWTIAVGRGWDAAAPNVAVGILSATNRSWGRSVQTDASISPANYGGPLVDIAGRVIGILAPLPADTAGMNLGTELYDSGIGFAVPLEDVLRVLPRLKAGQTLAPGVLGIGYESRDPFTGSATIATCRPGSPAAKAGLRPGDVIVAAGGRPVTRIAEFRHVIAPLYAGDTLAMTVERAGNAPDAAPARIDVAVELAKELPPWQRTMLGVVPVRTAGGRGNAAKGPVEVAWIWPGSPAEKAGIVPGERIESVVPAGGDAAAAVPVDSAAKLAGLVAGVEQGAALGLVVRGAAAKPAEAPPRSLSLSPVVLPGDPPAEVPALVPREGAAAAPGGDAVKVERLEAAEVAKPPLVVLPQLPAAEPLGVLVWIDQPRGEVADGEATAWKAAAARHGVAVILPGSADPQRWGREDIASIRRGIATLAGRRSVDPSRIAIAGRGAGGAFAWLVGEALGPAARGVAILDAGLPRQATIEPVEPGRGKWLLFGGRDAAAVARMETDRRRLERAGHLVGTLPVDAADAPPPAASLCGWVESLGVL
jgi:serine protease Do